LPFSSSGVAYFAEGAEDDSLPFIKTKEERREARVVGASGEGAAASKRLDIYKSIYIFPFLLPSGRKTLVESSYGGGRGPVAPPVFKTGLAANIVAGGFDSLPPPPVYRWAAGGKEPLDRQTVTFVPLKLVKVKPV
jgi:hypothetical protein